MTPSPAQRIAELEVDNARLVDEATQAHQEKNALGKENAEARRLIAELRARVAPTPDTLRRLARVVWINVAGASNPWFTAPASGRDPATYRQWTAWNQLQLDLTRTLFRVVFEGDDPTETLLREALDFLGA